MLVEEIGLYFVTVLVGLVVHGCIVLPLIYFLLARQNPLKMVRAALQALLTAFGTSSRCVGGVVQVPMIAEMGMWFAKKRQFLTIWEEHMHIMHACSRTHTQDRKSVV